MTCKQSADTCVQQHCSHCAGDAGTIMFDEAGAPPPPADAGSCGVLSACCDTLQNINDQSDCIDVVLTDFSASCSEALSGYQEGGLCQ
jgi:hypothetical protein